MKTCKECGKDIQRGNTSTSHATICLICWTARVMQTLPRKAARHGR